jgi:hypothetical protein
VELVHEDDDPALGLLDLLEDGLQPVLELAAVLRPRDQGADVERDHAPVAKRLRHVAGDDALREPLGDRRLADAGLADQHGVVLGPPREHLDHAPDLVVAADDGVELALLGELGEVAAEALECLVLVLGVRVGHAVRAAHLRERREDRVPRGAGALEDRRALGLRGGDREQQVLGRDELVIERRGLGLRRLEDAHELAGGPRLGGGRSADARQLVEPRVQLGADRVAGRAQLREQRRDDPALLLDQHREQVLGRDLGVAALVRQPLGGLDRLL